MSTPAPPHPADSGISAPRAIAPVLHTLVLVLALLVFSYAGARSQHHIALKHGPAPFYVATMFWEWLLAGYVMLGIRRRSSLRELIGGRWASVADFLNDIAVAVSFWLIALMVLGAIGYALGLSGANASAEAKQRIGFLIPQNARQLALFLCVSTTAGFCEELIFRGYLQRQFACWTRSSSAALLLQALVFGASHAYEGGKRMLLIAIYGAMFGALALWRRSLRPGMIGHALHDGWTGAMLYFFRRAL